MGSIARMDPKLPSKSQDVSGHPLQLLTRNRFFQSKRPKPRPLKYQKYGSKKVLKTTLDLQLNKKL